MAPGVAIRPGGLHFTFSRSSGPGGQAVNKISSKATLRVRIVDISGLDEFALARLRTSAGQRLTQNDELLITAETSRSQLDNKLECIERLRALIVQARKRPKTRRKSKPTRSMIEKRLESKRRNATKKGLRRGRRADRSGD
jgi:ribosome-associated protein